jgi:hypothetical protein
VGLAPYVRSAPECAPWSGSTCRPTPGGGRNDHLEPPQAATRSPVRCGSSWTAAHSSRRAGGQVAPGGPKCSPAAQHEGPASHPIKSKTPPCGGVFSVLGGITGASAPASEEAPLPPLPPTADRPVEAEIDIGALYDLCNAIRPVPTGQLAQAEWPNFVAECVSGSVSGAPPIS